MKWVSAADCGLALCEVCGRVENAAEHACCSRCHAPLHRRKPRSIERSWALLLAAYVLYLPANLLPIMETRSLFGVQRDTILSGVAFLWNSGSWALALIVFVASVVVPLLKLLSLSLILVSVQQRNVQARQCARLYRLLEVIGRWSMLDVYVVAVLVALVQAQSLATIAAGPGVLAFGAVVVLSMMATMAFDPRLIWDAASTHEPVEMNRESKRTTKT
ncbi:paraquat-inducible protein A [Rhodocyclus purpureus]|uniref:paraquat-inducible protein A n=1 Tax=Rhodocyclus purpureus TaxID=1067 RepID=UPI001911CB88|nr:paraquat-inducible protein A [Rhodocyclus purpureus]MBK5914561.1 paraquat-inducible membrane protein A [Rhodocyclus purpureus]